MPRILREGPNPGCIEYAIVTPLVVAGYNAALGPFTPIPSIITIPLNHAILPPLHQKWLYLPEPEITLKEHACTLQRGAIHDTVETVLALGGVLAINSLVEKVPAELSVALGVLGLISLASAVNVALQARNEKKEIDIITHRVGERLTDFPDLSNQDQY